MPTSAEEAQNIVSIMNDYLPFDKATEITKRLDQEVGSKTDNNSLKVSLQMLRALYENTPRPTAPPPSFAVTPPEAQCCCHGQTFWHNNAPLYLKLSLWGIVAFHMAVLAGNLLTIFLLPFITPWYISLPLDSLLINFMFSAVSCPLTRLESFVRRKIGLPEIRFFIKHYFFQPSYRKPRKHECES